MPPKRPWYRLHLSTWLVLLAVLTALVLIEVPGTRMYGYPIFPGVQRLQHGWPFVWLNRVADTSSITRQGAEVSDELITFWTEWPSRKTLPRAEIVQPGGPYQKDDSYPPWLDSWSWSITWGTAVWYPASLAVDLAIVLLVCLGVVAVHERWRRGRRKYWQFGIRGLLLFVALVAATMAWCRWEVHRSDRESHLAAELQQLQCDCCTRQKAPVWLGKLVPARYLMRSDRVDFVRARSMKGNNVDRAERMAKVAALVAGLANLEEFEVQPWDDAELKPLERLTQLRRLIMMGCFGDEGVRWIANLPRIESLMLDCQFARGSPSHPTITDETLARVSGMKTLRTLWIKNADITDAGLAHLAELPELQWLDLSGCQGITDAGVVHLKQLTRLEGIELYDTAITDAALGELRQALPDTRVGPIPWPN